MLRGTVRYCFGTLEMLRRTVRCYVGLFKMLRGTVICYVGLLKMLRSTVKMLRRTDYEKKFRNGGAFAFCHSKKSFKGL